MGRVRTSGLVFYRGLDAARAALGNVNYIIGNWLLDRGNHYLLGERGVGKTTLLVNLSLTLAAQRDSWFGEPMQRGYLVIYTSGETTTLMLDYAEAWHKQHNIARELTAPYWHVSPKVVDLRNEEQCAGLIADLLPLLEQGRKLIVIVDTWQTATPGADQSTEKEMDAAIKNTDLVSDQLQCPIIAAMHPPKSNPHTISGTGIIQNRGVAEWHLTAKGGLLQLENVRFKGLGQGSKLHFKTTAGIPIEGEDNLGRARTSVILEPAVNTEPQDDKVRNEWMEPLLEHLAQKPGLSVEARAKEMGPGWSPSTLRRRLELLVELEAAVRLDDGRYYVLHNGEPILHHAKH